MEPCPFISVVQSVGKSMSLLSAGFCGATSNNQLFLCTNQCDYTHSYCMSCSVDLQQDSFFVRHTHLSRMCHIVCRHGATLTYH